ncbi:hypothetical protein GCM10023085_33330 [Actinomadura viridis]
MLMSVVDRAELVSVLVKALRADPCEPLRLEYGPQVDYDLLVEAMREAMDAVGLHQGIRARCDPTNPSSTTYLEIDVRGQTVVSVRVRELGRPPIPRKVIRAYEQAHGMSDSD